jgi:hypothetical protein
LAPPADNVLQNPVEFYIAAVAAMGKEAGYRRDYRGVKRFSYDLPLEEDETNPWLQVELSDFEQPKPEANTQTTMRAVIFVQAHLFADKLANGDKDMIKPVLDFLADVEDAVFADRALGTNPPFCYLYRAVDHVEQRPFGIADEAFGSTVRVNHVIDYWFTTGDQSQQV